MATYQVADGQMLTATGHPTGLAAPSRPLDLWVPSGSDLIGGRTVSFSEIYRTQPWVAVNANKIARQVSRLPLKQYVRRGDGTRERITTGNLSDALRRPWTGAGPVHLKQALTLPTLVHGGSLMRKVRQGAVGPVVAFQPLVWGMLTVHRQSGGEIEVWETSQPGVPRYIDPPDVLHIGHRGLDGPLGVSPLEQLGVTLRIEDAAQRHQTALLRNGARPPSAVYASEEFLGLQDEERQALLATLRSDLDRLYAGPENQGRPALLPPGLKWDIVGHTAVEAELIMQRKLTREETAAVYDIPPPLIGILENATLANVDAYTRMLYTTILAPWLTLIEDSIAAQVIATEPTIRGDVFVEFDLNDVLRGDLLQRAQALATQIASGVLTIDEARELENRPRFDLPATRVPLYPANNLLPATVVNPRGGGSEPSSDQLAHAADIVSRMGVEDLGRVLRGSSTITEAIIAYAGGMNGNGAHPEGVT